MKHSYNPDAAHLDACARCSKELAHRNAQSRSDCDRRVSVRGRYHHTARKQKAERRPTPGSQEWAETRGDDLGESEDR